MTAFLDIADEGQRGQAPLRGKQVDIVGLSARHIARLLVNHPSAQKVLEGGTQVNLFELINIAPDAVCSLIAYGTGYDDEPKFGGDKDLFDKAVTRAMKLSAGEQADMVMAISNITFGERLNPFVNRLLARVNSRLDAPDKAPVSMPSLKQLRDALRSNTTPEQFGATRQDNSPATPDSRIVGGHVSSASN